jgi:hypothetical protein
MSALLLSHRLSAVSVVTVDSKMRHTRETNLRRLRDPCAHLSIPGQHVRGWSELDPVVDARGQGPMPSCEGLTKS